MNIITLIIIFLSILVNYIQHTSSKIIKIPKENKQNEIVTHKVFMDISVDKLPTKRIHIALFANSSPELVENFRLICIGTMNKENTRFIHYKGSRFKRIQRYSWMEGGDILDNDLYGVATREKGFYNYKHDLGHNGIGYVGMRADNETNIITSMFYFTSRKLTKFDDKNVIIGKILKEDERQWVRNFTRYHGDELGIQEVMLGHRSHTLPRVVIVDSGELPLDGTETFELNQDYHWKTEL